MSSLDTIDLKLLDLMQHDATRPIHALADLAHLSPATCHRRLKRLRDEGWIEREVALVATDKLREQQGSGLQAIVEVSLDVQTAEALSRFEAHAVQDAAVQQCWRVSNGPDFVLVLAVLDMPAYEAATQRLFTAAWGVRTVRAFFAVRRAKFGTEVPLAGSALAQ